MDAEQYSLFLDDDPSRIPNKLVWINLPSVEWTIVRTYNEFVDIINKRGLPIRISFDHDLGDAAYKEFFRAQATKTPINYDNVNERTGYDCALFIANYCVGHKVNIPEYYVHSLNGPGKMNIVSVLESAKKAMKQPHQHVLILVGSPGSGKSTWSKAIEKANPNNLVRICPDEFRAKLGNGENDQSVSAAAFEATRTAMTDLLDRGFGVIVDATNMYRKTREQFVSIAREKHTLVTAVVFKVNRDTLISRNINRGKEGGRNVPEDVIDKMLAKYQEPCKPEFDEVIFI